MEGISTYAFGEAQLGRKDSGGEGKTSLVSAIGVRQMDPRRAAMQGEKHKAARNLSRAGTARVHTRRLARASRLIGWIDL